MTTAEFSVTETSAVAKPVTGEPVYFNGEVWAVCKMMFKYTLLTLLTLGIYRFWAKTKLRRYFWSQTEFDGDMFEYHGTPKELFIGFLIVVAILVPLYFVLEAIRALLPLGDMGALVSYQAGYFLLFVVLYQIAVFRMMRYRLSRTSWRGVRFGLDGETLRYALMAIAATAVSVASIGVAYPWMRHWLIRYRIDNMRFGESRFSFGGTPMLLAKRWWIALVAGIVPISVTVIVGGIPERSDLSLAFFWDVYPPLPGIGAGYMRALLGAYVVSILVFLVMYIWYRVGEFRTVTAATSLGDTSMDSSLSTALFYGLFAIATGLFVAFGTLAMVIVYMLGGMMTGTIAVIATVSVTVFLLYASIPVIVAGVFGTLKTRAILNSVRVYNKESLGTIAQAAASDQRYGEGLADAFDVGAF